MSETRGTNTYGFDTWETLDACWRSGSLEHLLDSNQLAIYRAVFATPVLQFVIEASRKIGKSYLLGVVAFEAALRSPGKRINYAAPSGKEAIEITTPIMSQIATQAPSDCRPIWKPSLSHWEFPNGAFIVLFGADDQAAADRGRGPESILNIVDEAAFCPVLAYLLDSVLAPQTLQTQGRTIIASTPPVSPGHEFSDVADNAAKLGAYVHRDIYSHGRMSREDIDAYLTQRAQSRGLTLEKYKLTTDYRREYGAERVLDSNLAVVPEFPAAKARIVEAGRVAVRPPFFDLYVSIDPGMSDLTGVIFATTDFMRSKLVVEHELLLDRASTRTIAEEYVAVLAEHYPCPQEDHRSMRVVTKDNAFTVLRPHSAVIDDGGKRICADMQESHGLEFGPAQKDERETAINALRLDIAALKIEIHPRCGHLIRQLGNAVRKKPGGEMARSTRDAHFDLIDALLYLVRSWDRRRNPYPANWGFDHKSMARREEPKRGRSLVDVLAGR